MTKPLLPNLQKTVANTILIINISKKNSTQFCFGVENFDSGTPSAIFGTPQNAQNGSFWVFLAILGVLKMALRVAKSKF